MGNLSLIEYDQPRILPHYQLPSPSLCLALDEGHPLPILHPSLPLLTMTPPPSPTPHLTPPLTHSVLKGERSKRHKDWMDLYGLTKRGQHCRSSSPISQAKRESLSLFWRLERRSVSRRLWSVFRRHWTQGRKRLSMMRWDAGIVGFMVT